MSKTLSKKTLNKSFWNWFFWNGCSQQAESMLGMAFGQSMAPVIDEFMIQKKKKQKPWNAILLCSTQKHRLVLSVTVSSAEWKRQMPMVSALRKLLTV